MPLHIHPRLRTIELATESLGMIKTLDSVGFTVRKAAETAGTFLAASVALRVPDKTPYYWFLNRQTDVTSLF